MAARLWHGALALVVLVGLVVQLQLVAGLPSSPHLTSAGVVGGASAAGRYLRVFSFFTIQSNLLVLVTSLQLMVDPHRDGRLWRVLRLDALIGITVTGIVYATVLAAVHEPHGWQETLSNALFHYVSPVGALLGWLLFGPRPRLGPRTLVHALLFPAGWFAYTLVKGAIDPWYPYPFVDVTTHGYVRVLLNAVAVTVVLGLVGLLFRLGDRRLAPAPRWSGREPRSRRGAVPQ